MINKVEILRNYHDHAVIITLANESLSGIIVDDSQNDHCIVVKHSHLVEYYETKNESLQERVYFSDMKSIEYQ